MGKAADEMRKLVRIWTLLLALVVVAACMQPKAAYFNSAVDKATQEDVAATFGQPDLTKDLAGGSTAWLYRFGPAPVCEGYVLIFGQEKILRDWRQQTC